MYKVIATDLDGTLLNSDHQLDAYTVETVRALAARGVQFVLATGRHAVDVAGIRDVLGIAPYLISSNGARVHAPDGALLHARDLPAGTVRALVRPELVGEHGRVIVNLFTEREWLIDRDAPHLLDMHQDSGFAYQQIDLLAYAGEGVAKVLYIGDPADLRVIAERLAQTFGDALYVTYSLPDCLEVMAAGVSKGQALGLVLERIGVPAAACVAFGDNLNDIDMLETAGRPYMMANAHPLLAERLPHVPRIGRNDEAAVARQLSALFGLPAHALPPAA